MNYTNEMKSMVKAALDKRGWSKTEFMRRSGLARETARQIYNGVPVSIDEVSIHAPARGATILL